jgi:hypothetical protein
LWGSFEGGFQTVWGEFCWMIGRFLEFWVLGCGGLLEKSVGLVARCAGLGLRVWI